jgi:hypothetical protein
MDEVEKFLKYTLARIADDVETCVPEEEWRNCMIDFLSDRLAESEFKDVDRSVVIKIVDMYYPEDT